jgi:hypothetical protein
MPFKINWYKTFFIYKYQKIFHLNILNIIFFTQRLKGIIILRIYFLSIAIFFKILFTFFTLLIFINIVKSTLQFTAHKTIVLVKIG